MSSFLSHFLPVVAFALNSKVSLLPFVRVRPAATVVSQLLVLASAAWAMPTAPATAMMHAKHFLRFMGMCFFLCWLLLLDSGCLCLYGAKRVRLEYWSSDSVMSIRHCTAIRPWPGARPESRSTHGRQRERG